MLKTSYIVILITIITITSCFLGCSIIEDTYHINNDSIINNSINNKKNIEISKELDSKIDCSEDLYVSYGSGGGVSRTWMYTAIEGNSIYSVFGSPGVSHKTLVAKTNKLKINSLANELYLNRFLTMKNSGTEKRTQKNFSASLNCNNGETITKTENWSYNKSIPKGILTAVDLFNRAIMCGPDGAATCVEGFECKNLKFSCGPNCKKNKWQCVRKK